MFAMWLLFCDFLLPNVYYLVSHLLLQYLNCFYDFQEHCLPHQLLTRQQRRRRDLNFETETCLKLGDLDFFKKSETRKFADFAGMFFQIFKNVSAPLQSSNFANFRLFSYLLVLFLTYRRKRQNLRWIEEVSLNHTIAVFKVSRLKNRLETVPKVKHFRIWPFVANFST